MAQRRTSRHGGSIAPIDVMKHHVPKLDPQRVMREFPEQAEKPGWTFRVQETSAGVYLAEGTDLWGRRVSHQGTDPHALMQMCLTSARSIGV